jgi:heat shock protein HtpX
MAAEPSARAIARVARFLEFNAMARQRTAWPRDTGLQARILLTLFLLGLLYTVFVVVLLQAGAGFGVLIVVIGALVLGQLFLSDKLGLAAMGAKVVTPEQAPGLHAMIERLCIQADLPKPKVAVADTPIPNAFAMGRSQKNATVCATTGIMETLSPAELEGVMAHELSHVKNRDVLIMTIASFFATVAAVITQNGFFFGMMGGDDDEGGPAFIVVLLVSLLVYVISFFLMMALSRYREFAADRGAALITARPSALASALLRISGKMQQIPDRDLRAAGELNAFFIIPTSVKTTARTLFSTHPPLEQRIARLEQLEAQLQAGPVAA